MDNETSEEENQGTSKYNSAVAQLYRLDTLWLQAHQYSQIGDFKRYRFTLDRVWIELASDTSKKQKETKSKYENKLMEVNSIKIPFFKEGDIHSDEWDKKKKEIKQAITKKKNLQYQWLQRYEIFLRKVLNSQGKGSAYRNTSEESIE
jgi:hypothetical protein